MKLATVAAAIVLVVVTSAAASPFSDVLQRARIAPATAASVRSTRTAAAARAGARRRLTRSRCSGSTRCPTSRAPTAWPGPIPCRDIDLMAFLPHGEIGGGSGNDIWGWTDPVTGREYALVGRSTGTAFVDISNPSQPVYLGNLPTHDRQLDVARHQGLRRSRLHRQRGARPRHAGLRPHAASRRDRRRR